MHKNGDISLWDIANKIGLKLQLNFFSPAKEKAYFSTISPPEIGIYGIITDDPGLGAQAGNKSIFFIFLFWDGVSTKG